MFAFDIKLVVLLITVVRLAPTMHRRRRPSNSHHLLRLLLKFILLRFVQGPKTISVFYSILTTYYNFTHPRYFPSRHPFKVLVRMSPKWDPQFTILTWIWYSQTTCNRWCWDLKTLNMTKRFRHSNLWAMVPGCLHTTTFCFRTHPVWTSRCWVTLVVSWTNLQQDLRRASSLKSQHLLIQRQTS